MSSSPIRKAWTTNKANQTVQEQCHLRKRLTPDGVEFGLYKFKVTFYKKCIRWKGL